MKKLLPILAVIIGLFLSLLFPSVTNAAIIFSDPFFEKFDNSIWFVPQGAMTPVPLNYGITGANSSTWSIIEHQMNGNYSYEIQFDIYVNTDYINTNIRNWGIGIGDNTDKWKIINGYGSQLQLRENPNSVERNIAFNWNYTRNKHHFKIIVSPNSDTNYTVFEDDQQLISWVTNSQFDLNYIWISFLGHGDFEIANFQLCDSEGCEDVTPTNTPTPTPTATPTPSPTPTNTPTPTPPATNTLIVLPGMGGSWSNAILTCDPSSTGTWISTPKYGDMYLALTNTLVSRGYSVLPYYYDWRKNIPTHATSLSDFITRNTSANEKVNVVGHSMGGLVARAYVDYDGASGKIERLLTAGSPHRGTATAYPALAAGEFWTDEPAIKFISYVIKKWCGGISGLSDREVIQTLVPSFYNILPIEPFLVDQKTKILKPLGTLQNNWLPTSPFTPQLFGIDFLSLSGNNHQTLSKIHVQDHDRKSGEWVDGKPTKKEYVPSGDGTVLTANSMIAGLPNVTINHDHGGLVSSQEGINTILDFLGDSPLSQYQSMMVPQTSLAVVGYPGWFWLTDPDGGTTRDTQGLIVVANPKKGNYKLTFVPKTLGSSRIAIAQFLPNGKTLWKDYHHKGVFPKSWTITFDPSQPNADILR